MIKIMTICYLYTFVTISLIKRKKLGEKPNAHKEYTNMAAKIFLNAIVDQYETWAAKKGLPLSDKEKNYITALYQNTSRKKLSYKGELLSC